MDSAQDIMEKIGPLRAACKASSAPLPSLTVVERDAMPEPYKSLLVHDRSMTETLTKFHNQSLYIEVISWNRDGHLLTREVVLRRYSDDEPVEYGTITLALGWLPMPVREEVVEGRRPLGQILFEHEIECMSCPVAFIRAEPTDHIAHCLCMDEKQSLYGRVNRLFNSQWHPIADVVELLPVLDEVKSDDEAGAVEESSDAASRS